MPSRELTTDGLCEALDVAPRTLTGWRERGLPHDKKGKTCRYNLGEVATWMKANGLTGKVTGNIDKAHWDGRKIKALAERYELQLERERGSLIPLAEARQTYTNFVRVIRNRLQRMGVSLSTRWGDPDAARRQSDIEEEIRLALSDVSKSDEPEASTVAVAV